MRAQVIIEFVIMASLGLLLFTLVLVIIGDYIHRTQLEREETLVVDRAALLQQELLLAASSHEGYRRTITIPDRLAGQPFTLLTTITSVTVTLANNAEHTRSTPLTDGEFLVGSTNTLTTQNGVVFITQP